MKKTVIILLTLAVLLFAITAVASAESKKEYYASISSALEELKAAIEKGDTAKAEELLAQIRKDVYAALRFLVKINAYDARLMGVITNAEAALKSADYEDLIKKADAIAYMVLMDATPVEPMGMHS